jgi:hypothetical protein
MNMKAPKINRSLIGRHVLFAGFDNKVYRALFVSFNVGNKIAELHYATKDHDNAKALIESAHHNRIFEVAA